MDVKAKLADIDALIERVKEPLSRADAKREWKTLQTLLRELEGEAERLKLPTANVGEYGAICRFTWASCSAFETRTDIRGLAISGRRLAPCR